MKFSYQALNAKGRADTGTVEAKDLRAAKRKIRQKGLQLVSLNAYQGAQKGQRKVKKATKENTLLAFQQLVTLINSGIPIKEAVSSVVETQDGELQICFEELNKRINRGEHFSSALSQSNFSLPNYFYQLSEAGEMTGTLGASLKDSCSRMSYELEVSKEFKSALIYPAVLVLSGVLAVLIIFISVVPKFTHMLDKNVDLHWLAWGVLSIGKIFNENMLLVALVFGGALFGGVAYLQNPKNRDSIYNYLFTVPLIKEWLTQSELATWSGLLAVLLKNKVPLVQSIELANRSVKSETITDALSSIPKELKSGASVSQSLEDRPLFDSSAMSLLKVGEKSGNLPEMLESLSQIYSDDGKQRMKKFLTVLEPVSILIIGVVVGVIMIAIILAITSTNDLVI